MTTENQCPICQAPLTGRADQLVCSPACRVKAHRQRLRDEAALRALEEDEDDEYDDEEEDEDDEQEEAYRAPSFSPPSSPWPPEQPPLYLAQHEEEARRQREMAQDDEAEEATYAQAQHQRQVTALHKDYMLLIEQLLQWQDQWLTVRQLNRFHEEITRGLTRYKEHPDLADPASKARKRVTDLREALLLIGEVLEEAKTDRGNRYRSQYELTKRWRKKLLERLNP